MTSKHGRLSILVVALTLSACTTAGGAPSSDATQPPVAIQPAPVIVPPSAVVASPTPTPVPSASPEASSGDVDKRQADGRADRPLLHPDPGRGVAAHRRRARPGQTPGGGPGHDLHVGQGHDRGQGLPDCADHSGGRQGLLRGAQERDPGRGAYHRAPGLLRWLSDRQGCPYPAGPSAGSSSSMDRTSSSCTAACPPAVTTRSRAAPSSSPGACPEPAFPAPNPDALR